MGDPLQRPLEADLPVLVWALEDLNPHNPYNGQQGRQGGHGGDAKPQLFARDYEHSMAQEVVKQRRKIPAVINERALFTRAATFAKETDHFYHSPSARIASNYSPSSAQVTALLLEQGKEPTKPRSHLLGTRPGSPHRASSPPGTRTRPLSPMKLAPLSATAAALTGTSSGSAGATGSDADQELPARRTMTQKEITEALASTDRFALIDAALRYHYHIKLGIPAHHITPYKEEWLEQALMRVPEQSGLDKEYQDAFIEHCIMELQGDYLTAMRRSALNYTLLRPCELVRLGMQPLQPLLEMPSHWKTSAGRLAARQLPGSWRRNMAVAREEITWTLQTLSAHALALSRIWWEGGYSSMLAVDVDSSAFKQQLPMQALAFMRYQRECVERIKSQMWSIWSPKCADMFRRTPPTPINGDAPAYYRSIATLQGNQLRDLVRRSLEAYLALFRKHRGAPQVLDPQGDLLRWAQLPVFELKLAHAVDDGEVVVVAEPGFDQCLEVVNRVLEALVQAVAGIPRLGTAAAGSMSAGPSVPATSCIPTTSTDETMVEEAREELASILEEASQVPVQLMELLQPWACLLAADPATHLEDFMAAAAEEGREVGLEELGEEVVRLRGEAQAVMNRCSDDVRTGLYMVRCKPLKEAMAAAASQLADGLLEHVRATLKASSVDIGDNCAAMAAELAKPCSSGADVLALKKLIGRVTQDVEKLKERLAGDKHRLEFLHEHRHAIADSDLEAAIKAQEWPRRLTDLLAEASRRAANEHKSYEAALKARRKELGELVEALAGQVEGLEQRGELVKRDVLAAEVTELHKRLKRAEQDAAEVNIQEEIFNWAASRYPALPRLMATVEPYRQLWTSVSQFYELYNTWMNGPFARLSPGDVTAQVERTSSTLEQLAAEFAQGGSNGGPWEVPAGVVREAQGKVARFSTYLPLVAAVCNPGLQERHLAAMSEVAGLDIKRDEVTSMRRLIESDILDHVERLRQISDKASQEWAIEKALDAISQHWAEFIMPMEHEEEAGCRVVAAAGLAEAAAALDEHMAQCQAMLASQYAGSYQRQLEQLLVQLNERQDLLELLGVCQKRWLLLLPALAAPEVARQAPQLVADYTAAAATMAGLLQELEAAGPQQLFSCLVQDATARLAKLQACYAGLDSALRALPALYDLKRAAWAPLQLLTDGEMLRLLAAASHPPAVQPLVPRLYGGGLGSCSALMFEPDGAISGLLGCGGSMLQFVQSVYPAAYGSLEEWLQEVASQAQFTLRSMAPACLAAAAGATRARWALDWPPQLVLACARAMWTSEVEAARKRGGRALAIVAERYYAEAYKLQSVLTTAGQEGTPPLTPQHRRLLEALALQDKQCREAAAALAAAPAGTGPDGQETLWQAQLRIYSVPAEPPPKADQQPAAAVPKRGLAANTAAAAAGAAAAPAVPVLPMPDVLVVRCGDLEVPYGYEYWGNGSWAGLVAAEQVEQVEQQLAACLAGWKVPLLHGTAGCGKTTIMQHLAASTGRRLLAVTCCKELQPAAVTRAFRAAAATGGWLLLEGLELLHGPALATLSNHLSVLQEAASVDVVEELISLAGTCSPLKPTFRVLATTRSTAAPGALQEQLVPLPVLPVAPATIAASALQATGCGTAKQLVTRLAKLLAAAQEHLPSLASCQLATCLAGAGRYSTASLSGEPAAAVDLRPVAALVAAARHQRALFGPLPEEEVLVSAALLVLLPLLPQQDLPAFDDLMAHAFPAAPEQELEPAVKQAKAELDEATGVLEQALDTVIPRLHLQLSNAQKAKAVQLDDALQAAGTSPVLLTGSPCSGKTTVVRLLSAALQARPASGMQPAPAVTLTTLHPAALPVEKLLGSFSGDVGWEDGALAAAVRAAIQAQCSGPQRVETRKQQPQHWLHIRGPTQGTWADVLQPLMAPEGPHLQLGTGEVLLLPANTRVILEVPAEVPCAQDSSLEAAGGAGSLSAALAIACSSSICCQPGLLSWKEMLLPAWLAELPAALLPGDVLRPALLELLDQLLPPCLAAACGGDGIPAVSEAQLALRTLQVLHALLQSSAAASPVQALSQGSVPASSGLHPRKHLVAGRLMSEQMQLLQAAVVTAVTWGLGGHLDEAARTVLDARLRPVLAQAVVAEHPLSTPPEARSLFDYVFDPPAMKWVTWAELVAPAVAAAMQSQAAGRKAGSTSEEVPELLVPTEEALRCGWLLQLLQQAGVAVGLVGPAGAGKSALLRHLVQRQQQEQQEQQQQQQQQRTARDSRPVCYSHSGSSTAQGLKQALAGHSSSAAAGGCGLVVVDGLQAGSEACLPLAAALHHLLEGPEEADAQVPALLAAADASTAAASLSALPHQMFSIWMEQPSDECLSSIFHSQVEQHQAARGLGPQLAQLARPLALATLHACSKLPTRLLSLAACTPDAGAGTDQADGNTTAAAGGCRAPLLAKVPRGMCARLGVLPLADAGQVQRLWLHELLQLLVAAVGSDEELAAVVAAVAEACEEKLKQPLAQLLALEPGTPLVEGATQLVYSSLLASEAQGQAAAEQYRPVADMAVLRVAVQETMSKPAAGRQAVLPDCSWTATLAARACSALTLPSGHLAIIKGQQGSEALLLAHTAAALLGFEVVHASPTVGTPRDIDGSAAAAGWEHQAKRAICLATEGAKKVALVLDDSCIAAAASDDAGGSMQQLLEGLENLCAWGEVPPQLMTPQEVYLVQEALKPDLKAAGLAESPAQVAAYFRQALRSNLHVIVCCSEGAARQLVGRCAALAQATQVLRVSFWPAVAVRQAVQQQMADGLLQLGALLVQDGAQPEAGSAAAVQLASAAVAVQRALGSSEQGAGAPAQVAAVLEQVLQALPDKQAAIKGRLGVYEAAAARMGAAEALVQQLAEQVQQQEQRIQEQEEEAALAAARAEAAAAAAAAAAAQIAAQAAAAKAVEAAKASATDPAADATAAAPADGTAAQALDAAAPEAAGASDSTDSAAGQQQQAGSATAEQEAGVATAARGAEQAPQQGQEQAAQVQPAGPYAAAADTAELQVQLAHYQEKLAQQQELLQLLLHAAQGWQTVMSSLQHQLACLPGDLVTSSSVSTLSSIAHSSDAVATAQEACAAAGTACSMAGEPDVMDEGVPEIVQEMAQCGSASDIFLPELAQKLRALATRQA